MEPVYVLVCPIQKSFVDEETSIFGWTEPLSEWFIIGLQFHYHWPIAVKINVTLSDGYSKTLPVGQEASAGGRFVTISSFKASTEGEQTDESDQEQVVIYFWEQGTNVRSLSSARTQMLSQLS